MTSFNLPQELARQLDKRAEEIAALKEGLECERLTWRRHWSERDQAALIAERQLEAMRAALAEIAREQSAKTATEAADRFQAIARTALTRTESTTP